MGAGLHRSHPDHRVIVGSWLQPYSGNESVPRPAFNTNQSPITNHQSPIANHQSPITRERFQRRHAHWRPDARIPPYQGAIGVHACSSGAIKPAGMVVVDTVEGAVLDGIEASKIRAEARPSLFLSSDEAIRWALGAGGLLKNEASARISIPMMLWCEPQATNINTLTPML